MLNLGRRAVRCWFALTLFSAVNGFASISGAGGGGPPQIGPQLHYADVVQATQSFDHVVLWEGLPHFGEKTRQAEMAKGTHFEIGGESFYHLPLPLTAGEQTLVSAAIVGTRSNFLPWSGFKFCGGFHADYAVEWRRDGKLLAQAEICFTCGEARFFVGNRMENVDLSKSGKDALRQLLWPHHALRPRPGEPSLAPPPLPPHSGAQAGEPVFPPTPQPPPMPEAGKAELPNN